MKIVYIGLYTKDIYYIEGTLLVLYVRHFQNIQIPLTKLTLIDFIINFQQCMMVFLSRGHYQVKGKKSVYNHGPA